MKLFALAALLGAVTVSAQDNMFAEEETESLWVSQNKKALQMECGRIKIRLTQAYQYARVVTGLTDTQKGVPSIQAANTALNGCTYDNIAYKCPEAAKETFFLKLKFARADLGNVCRMNTDENLEHAYNSVYWAYEYGLRCVNPKAYYETLLDVKVAPADDQIINGKFGDLKQTIAEHNTHPQLKAVGQAFKKLENTPEVQALGKQDVIMQQSAEFKQAHAKAEATVADIKQAVQGTSNGFHVDNVKIPELRKEVRETKQAVRQLAKSEQGQAYKAKVHADLETEAADNLKTAVRAYKRGDGQELKQKIHAMKRTLKTKVQVTNKPTWWVKKAAANKK